jgi:hypothetical protein
MDGRAIGLGGQRSKRIDEEDCGGVRWWADRINPIAPQSAPFKYLVKTLATLGWGGYLGRWLSHHKPTPRVLVGQVSSSSGSGFL